MEYARSPVVYRTLRETLGPGLKAEGYKRVPGTAASWRRVHNDGLEFKIGGFVSQYGGGEIGGGSLEVDFALYPSVGERSEVTVRYQTLTRCLVEHELEALRALQSRVNLRRPMSPTVAEWINDGNVQLLQAFQSVAQPFTIGAYRPLEYFSVVDVQEFAQLVKSVLPAVVPRFLENRCPPPVYVPNPMLSRQDQVVTSGDPQGLDRA